MGQRVWADRGGTFTDIVVILECGRVLTQKVLSTSQNYDDPISHGISKILTEHNIEPDITELKIATTLTTNSFLEKTGAKTLLMTNLGFEDIPKIRYQNRPDIFALDQPQPTALCSKVEPVWVRRTASGDTHRGLHEELVRSQLQQALDAGFQSVAIALLHSIKAPDDERKIQHIAYDLGFPYAVCSHEVFASERFIERLETTVLDAYLSPVIKAYTDKLSATFPEPTKVYYMQSQGNTCPAKKFRGSNSLLSGPAAGLMGATKMAEQVAIRKLISFDMGGTSTDIALCQESPKISFHHSIDHIPLWLPMLDITTIAAGGGSICRFDGTTYQVGPASAGANPGPACYGLGGPFTITDANLMTGRLQPSCFPKVFGHDGRSSIQPQAAKEALSAITADGSSAPHHALEFLKINAHQVGSAIREKALQEGIDVTKEDYTLTCFGGAGPQLACLIADDLGCQKIYIPGGASVLSAVGLGISPEATMDHVPYYQDLVECLPEIQVVASQRQAQKPVGSSLAFSLLCYTVDSRNTIAIPLASRLEVSQAFAEAYQRRFGFENQDPLHVAELVVTTTEKQPSIPDFPQQTLSNMELSQTGWLWNLQQERIPLRILAASSLSENTRLKGPVLITHEQTSITVEPGWTIRKAPNQGYFLERLIKQTEDTPSIKRSNNLNKPTPASLTIFNHQLMSIARQMGSVLKKTARSVNIRERLDFSCAIFSKEGELLANAPHIPVHLGSMAESIHATLDAYKDSLTPGQAILVNAPTKGGTHLPDLTIVYPVWSESGQLLCFTAARAHHADIGGIEPGSMPALSVNIMEEGIVFDLVTVSANGVFLEKEFLHRLQDSPYPARNPEMNISDLKAQIAACHLGGQFCQNLWQQLSPSIVEAHMKAALDYGETCIRALCKGLEPATASLPMDNGSQITVTLTPHADMSLSIDFSGTSARGHHNFHAPKAVTKAAIVYVLRTLIDKPIPLNSGCLRPIRLHIPKGCFLDPDKNSAVVAGNVETSQVIVDTLYRALGRLAASTGTMNNLSFGNTAFQYYETVAGGSGAGPAAMGSSGIQCHMTNSLLTDPEVLERKFPVLVHQHNLRLGTGGLGRQHGGHGIYRRLEFLEPCQLSVLAGRRRHPSLGLQGGSSGQPGETILHQNNKPTSLPPRASVAIARTDHISILTPGGGGFGNFSGHQQKQLSEYYFAFGSNMDHEQIVARCPSSQLATPLPCAITDHQLGFTLHSRQRQCRVADITSAHGHRVWGLLYRMTAADLNVMDTYEDFPRLYLRRRICVHVTPTKKVWAWVYFGKTKLKPGPTSIAYWYQLYKSAVRFGFPEEYLQELLSHCPRD